MYWLMVLALGCKAGPDGTALKYHSALHDGRLPDAYALLCNEDQGAWPMQDFVAYQGKPVRLLGNGQTTFRVQGVEPWGDGALRVHLVARGPNVEAEAERTVTGDFGSSERTSQEDELAQNLRESKIPVSEWVVVEFVKEQGDKRCVWKGRVEQGAGFAMYQDALDAKGLGEFDEADAAAEKMVDATKGSPVEDFFQKLRDKTVAEIDSERRRHAAETAYLEHVEATAVRIAFLQRTGLADVTVMVKNLGDHEVDRVEVAVTAVSSDGKELVRQVETVVDAGLYRTPEVASVLSTPSLNAHSETNAYVFLRGLPASWPKEAKVEVLSVGLAK